MIGAVLIVAGLVGGVVLWQAADQRRDDAIAGLARAPVGCDTVLDFDRDGEYLLFVETTGTLDEVRGDCGDPGPFSWSGEGELPTVDLVLVGPDGDELTLDGADDVTYDGGGSSGSSVSSVTIEQAGDHTLRVESPDEDVAVAVGRDPNDGVALMRIGAVLAALVGVVAGAALIAVGRRRRHPAPTASGPWAPTAVGATWPTSPPGFPAPPPTTGATGVVGPPTGPPLRPATGPLPRPPEPRPPDTTGRAWDPPSR